MLQDILSITGKPGLFRIIANGKGVLLVEDITTKRRFPCSTRDKVVSLGNVAMYTEAGDTPLGEILDKVYAHFDGKKIEVKKLIEEGELRNTFQAIVEDFDRDRVYDNDIKKLFTWYNLLVDAGMTKFVEEEKEEEKGAEEEK